MGDVAGVPDPIDITTVQPGQAVSVDRTVAMQWDGGDAVVVTGEVKSVHGTNPPVRYIEVHPVGARKGLKRKVREDPRLMEASESSSSDSSDSSSDSGESSSSSTSGSESGRSNGSGISESSLDSWDDGCGVTGGGRATGNDTGCVSGHDSSDSESAEQDPKRRKQTDPSDAYPCEFTARPLIITVFKNKFQIIVRGKDESEVESASPEMLHAVLAKLCPALDSGLSLGPRGRGAAPAAASSAGRSQSV